MAEFIKYQNIEDAIFNEIMKLSEKTITSDKTGRLESFRLKDTQYDLLLHNNFNSRAKFALLTINGEDYTTGFGDLYDTRTNKIIQPRCLYLQKDGNAGLIIRENQMDIREKYLDIFLVVKSNIKSVQDMEIPYLGTFNGDEFYSVRGRLSQEDKKEAKKRNLALIKQEDLEQIARELVELPLHTQRDYRQSRTNNYV